MDFWHENANKNYFGAKIQTKLFCWTLVIRALARKLKKKNGAKIQTK